MPLLLLTQHHLWSLRQPFGCFCRIFLLLFSVAHASIAKQTASLNSDLFAALSRLISTSFVFKSEPLTFNPCFVDGLGDPHFGMVFVYWALGCEFFPNFDFGLAFMTFGKNQHLVWLKTTLILLHLHASLTLSFLSFISLLLDH